MEMQNVKKAKHERRLVIDFVFQGNPNLPTVAKETNTFTNMCATPASIVC